MFTLFPHFRHGAKQLPGDREPAVNMAEELLETVERLQSRLLDNTEPRKVPIKPIYTDFCVF